jgi:hypothetical protein
MTLDQGPMRQSEKMGSPVIRRMALHKQRLLEI